MGKDRYKKVKAAVNESDDDESEGAVPNFNQKRGDGRSLFLKRDRQDLSSSEGSEEEDEMSPAEKENMLQFIYEMLLFYTKIVYFQAGAFIVEDLAFLVTPFKLIPVFFLFFHGAFIYAAYAFYEWGKLDEIKTRKAILRAV